MGGRVLTNHNSTTKQMNKVNLPYGKTVRGMLRRMGYNVSPRVLLTPDQRKARTKANHDRRRERRAQASQLIGTL
jgi:hypothetical protein